MTDGPRRMTPAEHAAADAAFRSSITIVDEGYMTDDPRIEAAHASLLATAGQHSMTMSERIRHMLAAADAVALEGADALVADMQSLRADLAKQRRTERDAMLVQQASEHIEALKRDRARLREALRGMIQHVAVYAVDEGGKPERAVRAARAALEAP